MSPSTFHVPSTKNFAGHFRSSPSSAESASNQPSNIRIRHLASRPRVPGRAARTTKTKILPKDGQHTNESPSEPDPEETMATDAPQPQPYNNGGSSSSFTPYTTTSAQDSLWDVAAKVMSTNDQKLGKIYVHRDPNSEDSVFKIGTTERPYVKRRAEHKRCCTFEPKDIHASSRDIENSVRLEKLIGWALADQRMVRSCHKVTKGHNEWFKAEEETVIKTVKQFEDFMDHEQPYNAQGNLSIIWRYLLRNRSPRANDVRRLCAKTQDPQWAEILGSPKYKDYAYAYLSHAGSEFRRLRGWRPESYWKLSTVIYSLWTLALSRNVVAFYALVVVLGCAGNTLIPEPRYKNQRSNSPNKDTPKTP